MRTIQYRILNAELLRHEAAKIIFTLRHIYFAPLRLGNRISFNLGH